MSMMHTLAGLLPKSPYPIQKGYGHVYGASTTANLDMSYANVDGGSAPEAGDLVVWAVVAGDNMANPIVDLSGSGWAQGNAYTTVLGGAVLGKVVTAGDLSSPPMIVNGPLTGSFALWAAYTLVGTAGSLTASTPNLEYSANSAPSNQVCDSPSIGAGKVAITLGVGAGDDGSPTLVMTGATAGIDFTSGANVWNNDELRFLVNVSPGGANITFSKSDDGGGNMMLSGFITVA